MSEEESGGNNWTVGLVEGRLIDAFRALPHHPVYTSSARVLGTLGDSGKETDALNWAKLYVTDKDESRALLTWARCRATGDSVRERYRALGWKRTTAERARQRALGRIVAGLQR